MGIDTRLPLIFSTAVILVQTLTKELCRPINAIPWKQNFFRARNVQGEHIRRITSLINVPCLKRLVTGLSPRRPGFAAGSIHVGFVVDKVKLGQVYLRVLRLYPVNIIPPWLSILSNISSGGMNNMPVGGCSSETYS
jgi:hypothetical protein